MMWGRRQLPLTGSNGAHILADRRAALLPGFGHRTPGWPGGDGRRHRGGPGLPYLASKPSFRAMCIAAQDVWVLAPRWSRMIIATASRWVSPEPAVDA